MTSRRGESALDDEVIFAYASSKGAEPQGTAADTVRAIFQGEYGRQVPLTKRCVGARVITVPLHSVRGHGAFRDTIEAREPRGEPFPLLGVVVRGDGFFYLLDGHHRWRWCLERGVAEMPAIELLHGEEVPLG